MCSLPVSQGFRVSVFCKNGHGGEREGEEGQAAEAGGDHEAERRPWLEF